MTSASQTSTPPRMAALALGAVVLLCLAHLVAVAVSLDAPFRVHVWHDVFGWAGSIIGVVGSWAAVTVFARGDHLRRVWELLFASSVLLLIGTAMRSHWLYAAPGREFLESPMIVPRALVVIAANVTAIWALLLLVSTYRKSGLQAPWTPRSLALLAVVGAAAIALGLKSFLELATFGGAAQTASALTGLGSTVGDTVTIFLVVPLLRVAYLLRGGRLAWTWWAVGLSGAVWLLYDGRVWIADLLPGTAADNLELIRVLRTPGLALVGLAGVFQREALRDR